MARSTSSAKDNGYSISFEVEHHPETHRTLENDHTVTEQTLPGTIDVYVVINGGRLLFTSYKAGKVFDAIEQAKQSAASSTAADNSSDDS